MDNFNQRDIIELVDENKGIIIAPAKTSEDMSDYIKLPKDSFSKINSAFQGIPHALKSIYDMNQFSGCYRVVYDKGLGTLQRSAQDPALFRANIVTPGANNDIKGQALLQEINPSAATSLSTIALSAFTLASIATNQYFLARIDSKLEALESRVAEVLQFLELEKGSQLWADGEFLKSIQNNLEYVLEDDRYCQATLTTVQKIRNSSLANIKFYHEQLNGLKEILNKKDKDKDFEEKLGKYQSSLPKFWYSVFLYEQAYFLEVNMMQTKNKVLLINIAEDMFQKIQMFAEGYSIISTEINKYIDEVKALSPNTLPSKLIKASGKFFEYAVLPANPALFFGAKGLGIALEKGGDALESKEVANKAARKQDIIDCLEASIQPFADLEPFKVPFDAVKNINNVYNNRLEIIVDENNAYIKNETFDFYSLLEVE